VTDGRELARRYLEQQRQLGGEVIVASDGRTVGQSDGGAAAPQHALPPTPGSRPEIVAPPEAPGLRAGPAKAKAPTPVDGLPSAGISYEPPAHDFFTTNPIQQATSLEAVATLVHACQACRLCEGRTHAVPGEGPAHARLVVVGEGPGRTEDETGRPFVGQAGELLTKILAAIDLPREQVFICNVVKCRPPENRAPQFDEIQACVPYLFRQIELIHPAVILAMGTTAAQTLLDTKQSLGSLRNKVHRFRGTPLIVTYHPAALLRNPNWKRPTWDDIRIARRLLDG
jgi:DNA polymerase